jgi:16S rRNA C967 or C1407 C5-methylase (RsmB/RsmF family)/NOL1/NOP2/fmu family ribosome biogenesis protein
MKTPLPTDFVSHLEQATFVNGHELAGALDTEAPVSIRVHPTKKNGFAGLDPVPWCDNGFYLSARPQFTLDPFFHAGGYYVQEASSMFLAVVVDQLNLGPVCALDLCAAPGGKSSHLASLLGSESLLVSNEAIRGRCGALMENLTKWGTANTVVTHNDPSAFEQLPGFFDLVLVDAPCSGEGMFRKDPDARAHWSPEHVEHCTVRQNRILKDIWPTLKENGVLIYSTCTFNEKENEQQLISLRATHAFESVRLKLNPDWNVVETEVAGIFSYRFLPDRLRGEGFFISVVRKTESAASFVLRKNYKARNTIFTPYKASRMPWLSSEFSGEWFTFRDQVLALSGDWLSEVEALANRLTILQTGTTLGIQKNNKIAPAHDLAMSIYLADDVPRLEVDVEQALHYLRKESWDHQSREKGFYLVSYEQQSLGWINHLGNRINNLYPAEWRIRLRG